MDAPSLSYPPPGTTPSTPRRDETALFIEIGRRLDSKGWVAANDGNLSVRLPADAFRVTASGSKKGYLRPEDVLDIEESGRVLRGHGCASSEWDLHRTIYAEREDVHAVVHAHPPVATAFAVARRSLEDCVLPELVLTLGRVPLAPYATPGTPELGRSVVEAIHGSDAVLLANHGAVTVGPDLETAYFTMERLEHGLRILFYAELLGQVTSLNADEVGRLLRTDPTRGRDAPLPCRPSVNVGSAPAEDSTRDPVGSSASHPDDTELMNLIREVLAQRKAGHAQDPNPPGVVR